MPRVPRVEIVQGLKAIQAIIERHPQGIRRNVLDLLLALHDGNLSRYRLRPSEFRPWKTKYQAAANSL
jgi:hypothetical protein